MPMTGGGGRGGGKERRRARTAKFTLERESAGATSARKKKKKKRKPREKSCHTRGRYTFRKVHRRRAPRSVEKREREAGKRARNQNGWGVTVNKGERGGGGRRGHVAGGVKEIQNTSCNSHFQKTAAKFGEGGSFMPRRPRSGQGESFPRGSRLRRGVT